MLRKTVTKSTAKEQTDKAEQKYSDPVIEGILKNDSRVIGRIYNEQFDRIRSMVYNFQKLNLEPEDVFQEGLTRAILNVRKGVFKGDSAFSTYLYSICNNICLKEYRRKKHTLSIGLQDSPEELPLDNNDVLQIILEEKAKLDEKCRELIDLRFGLGSDLGNTRFETIAAALDIKPDNARQRFGRCFAKFMKMLQNNSEFKLLTR